MNEFSRTTTNNQVWEEPFFTRINWGTVLLWVILLFFIFLTLFPFYWVLRTALSEPNAVYAHANELLPYDLTSFNFERVLGMIDPQTLVGQQASNLSVGTLNFWIYLRNSFLVAGLITLGQTLFSTMAAYAFARIKFPFRDQIFFIYLTGLMVPSIVLFIPNFVLTRQLGWIGTFQGIIAPGFLMTPFAVFFMRQFFLGLNREIEEAALMDGATLFSVVWRVSLPLTSGPLLTLALLTFVASWNDYLWPLLVGRNENVRVLTVALSVFQQQTPQGSPDWAGLMAGTVVSIVPTILLFIFFGRRIVDSIQFSGFK